MSVSGEKLNLLIMRDSGETKRFRVRRSFFHTCITMLFCFPILAGFAVWGCYELWKENTLLKQQLIAAKQLSQDYSVKSQKLETLEKLIEHDASVKTRIEHNVTATVKQEETTQAVTSTSQEANTNSDKISKQSGAEVAEANQEEVPMDEGPGHVDFPVIDEGIVLIENVTSRLVEPRRIRTSLDLRNPGTESLAGKVFCILSLANGETVPLELSPTNVGSYRILRWKKAVLFADVPEEQDLFNAQMVIEVKDSAGKLLYRNIFPIEQ